MVGPPAAAAAQIAQLVPSFTQSNDTIVLNTSGTYHALSGNDVVSATSGTYKLYGDDGNDLLTLASGKDQLHGGQGDDSLAGGGGNDKLFGDDGSDWLFGGGGNDKLTGGAGMDFFVFDSGDGKDKVMDFQDGVDDVLIYRELWGGAALTASQIEARFGHSAAGGYVLDFGNGNTLTFAGLANGAALLDQILVVHH